MTSDDLRSLADEATPGPWTWPDMFVWGFSGPKIARLSEAKIPATDALLAALAPDLARLCADALDVVAELLWDEWSAERPYTGSFPEIEEMFVRLESLEAR